VRREAQRIGHRAVRARDRDERAPRVVLAPSSQADALQVLVKPAQAGVDVAEAPAARRHDQVVRPRLAARERLEARQLP
jgi:hypothetical protein